MAASKVFWYTSALKYLMKGAIDLETGTVEAIPLKDTYTPGTASHSVLAQISTHQATASGSIINAIALSSLNVTGSGVATAKFDAADTAFSGGGATIASMKYVGIYLESASSGGVDNLLVGFLNLDADSASASAGNTTQVNVNWDSLAILKLRGNP